MPTPVQSVPRRGEPPGPPDQRPWTTTRAPWCLSEVPFDRSLQAALDPAAGGWGTKLGVSAMQQVLPYNGQVELSNRAPGEARIQLGIVRQLLIGDLTHVPQAP